MTFRPDGAIGRGLLFVIPFGSWNASFAILTNALYRQGPGTISKSRSMFQI